jgi:hypothetical protein
VTERPCPRAHARGHRCAGVAAALIDLAPVDYIARVDRVD